jgi:hypothetical protein
MDQEMTLYIFNHPRWIWLQEDSLNQLGKTKRMYDSLMWKDVGESCLFGLKVFDGCHESMINIVCNDFGNKLIDNKDVTSNVRIRIL